MDTIELKRIIIYYVEAETMGADVINMNYSPMEDQKTPTEL